MFASPGPRSKQSKSLLFLVLCRGLFGERLWSCAITLIDFVLWTHEPIDPPRLLPLLPLLSFLKPRLRCIRCRCRCRCRWSCTSWYQGQASAFAQTGFLLQERNRVSLTNTVSKEKKKEAEGRGGLVVLVLVTMIDKFELLPFWFPSFLVFSITYRNLFSGGNVLNQILFCRVIPPVSACPCVVPV